MGVALGDLEEKTKLLQSTLQKEKEELRAAQEALQKYQHQYTQMLKSADSAETPDTRTNKTSVSIPSKTQSIGAADLLKKDIRTFLLLGRLANFLGSWKDTCWRLPW